MKAYFATGIEMLGKHTQYSFTDILFFMPILLDLSKGISGISGREDDRRGYLTLLSVTTGEILFTVPFGEIPEDKIEKYFEFSQEKALRLFSQVSMHLPNQHTSSFQSRNEQENKYGGAIYSNCHSYQHIFSFSGMPELVDEALMLVLAKQLAIDTSHVIVQQIDAFERNPYWEQLADAFVEHPMMKMYSA